MKTLKEHWPIFVAILFIFFMNKCQHSTYTSNVKKLTNANDSLMKVVSNLSVKLENVQTTFAIEGLKTSSRMLYNTNYILLRKTRPDSMMNIYSLEIEKLEKQLKK